MDEMVAGEPRKRSPWPFVLVVALLATVLWVGAIAVGVGGLGRIDYGFGSRLPASQTFDRSAPAGELKAAELRMSYGAASIHLRSADIGGDLYRAHFQTRGGVRPATSLDSASGLVKITLDQHGSGCFLFCRDTGSTVDLTLSDKLPWQLTLAGGASHAVMDLSGVQLTGLDVAAGAADVVATLPAPKGHVAITVDGGASSVQLRAPAPTQARIQVTGGTSSLRVNGSASASLGDGVDYRTDGYSSAGDAYDVRVSGGASSVSWDSA